MKIGYNWLNIIQDYLLPPTCLLCGNRGVDSRDLCAGCRRDLPRNHHCCPQCAQLLEPAAVAHIPCGRCLSLPPAFDKTYAPFIHAGAIRYLITSLKFKAEYKNARLLGQLLAEQLRQTAEMPDLILPVPLHKSRYRERGFNQSIEIARTVGRELHIPLDLTTCRRHLDTPHQSRLTAEQRRKNLKNAFAVVKPVNARHIAILDDVMTTGSTVRELASVLKKAGIEKVDVWVSARA